MANHKLKVIQVNETISKRHFGVDGYGRVCHSVVGKIIKRIESERGYIIIQDEAGVNHLLCVG